jgi:hypothetical protein
MPPLFCFFFDGIIQSWRGVLALWWCGCQGVYGWTAVPPVSVVPPNSIKKLLLCVTGSSQTVPAPIMGSCCETRWRHAEQSMWPVTRPYTTSHVHESCRCSIAVGTLV